MASMHAVVEKCAEESAVMLAVQHQSAEMKEQACAVITKSAMYMKMQAERNTVVLPERHMR